MSLIVKYGLDKFISSLYLKEMSQRIRALKEELPWTRLLLVAKHFKIKNINTKDDLEIIIEINDLIESENVKREVKCANRQTIENLREELGESKIVSYFEWQQQFKECSEEVNTLEIRTTDYNNYMENWKKEHLPEAQH